MHTQMKSNKPVGNYTQWHFCVEWKVATEWNWLLESSQKKECKNYALM